MSYISFHRQQYDPVYFCTTTGKWGFFDESEAYWHGGYATEAEAREGLMYYTTYIL